MVGSVFGAHGAASPEFKRPTLVPVLVGQHPQLPVSVFLCSLKASSTTSILKVFLLSCSLPHPVPLFLAAVRMIALPG